MRTLFRGDVWLSYSQMYVESAGPPDDGDLRAAFAGQRNGLCGAAVPGRLWLITGLHTGVVACTVELHGEVPPVGGQWEEVVEASFTPSTLPVTLTGCMANDSAEFVLGPGIGYRVRYCASGMDAGKAADVRRADEPEIDRYLLQFWPAPPRPDEVLRQTGAGAAYWHEFARNLPSAAEVAGERAEAAARAGRKVDERRERFRLQRENLLWRGVRPDGPIADIPEAAQLAQLDRPLLDALAAAAADRHRQVARFAARRALTEAGLADIDWIAAALAALDAGEPLPPPFDDHALTWQALWADERVPATTVRSPDGTADNWSQQAMTLPALLCAGDPDPLRAAVASLMHATVGGGLRPAGHPPRRRTPHLRGMTVSRRRGGRRRPARGPGAGPPTRRRRRRCGKFGNPRLEAPARCGHGTRPGAAAVEHETAPRRRRRQDAVTEVHTARHVERRLTALLCGSEVISTRSA